MSCFRRLRSDLVRVTAVLAALWAAGCLNPGTDSQSARSKSGEFRLKFFCGGGVRAPVSECLAEFQRQTGIEVDARFGSSRKMFNEARGRGGDMYMAGDIEFIHTAEREGDVLARQTVCYVVPVLAVPSGNPRHISSIKDLARPGLRFYLVDAQRCQQGILGERLLAAHGVTSELLSTNRISQLPEDVSVADMLAAGELDAAMIWAHGSRRMKEGVQILRLPELTAAACPIAAVVLRGGGNRAAAQRLLAFLAGPSAAAVFVRHGFSLQPPETSTNSGLELPAFETCTERQAVRFNRTAKARPVIYTGLPITSLSGSGCPSMEDRRGRTE